MAVIDVAAIAQLAMQLQGVLQLVGLNVKDLAALPNMAVVTTMTAELSAMASEVAKVYSALDSTRQGWLMLTEPSALPTTLSALWSWQQQASMWGLQGARGATQSFGTVIGSSTKILQSMLRIVNTISVVQGTTSGLQTTSANISLAIGQLEQLKAAVLPHQQVLIGEQMITQVTALAMPNILAQEMRHWGKMP